jgi:hypothetical protein
MLSEHTFRSRALVSHAALRHERGMIIRLSLPSLGLALALAGCTQFPELEGGRVDSDRSKGYPGFLPMDQLLTGDPRQATPEVITGIDARVAVLQARAGALMRQQPSRDAGLQRRIARLQQKADVLRNAE